MLLRKMVTVACLAHFIEIFHVKSANFLLCKLLKFCYTLRDAARSFLTFTNVKRAIKFT